MQYRVSVNGKVFDVVIELVDSQQGSAALPAPISAPAPVPATPLAASAPATPTPPASGAEERVHSPMPGNIWAIPVSVGQSVSAGECLIVLESMKMENDIVAPRAGVVKQILVAKGTAVETNDILVVLD